MYMIFLRFKKTIKVVGKENGRMMKFDTIENAEIYAKTNLKHNYKIVEIPTVGMIR